MRSTLLLQISLLSFNPCNDIMSYKESTLIPINMHISCHHFPVSLLEWRKNNPNISLTSPLSLKLTSEFSAEDYSYNRLSADTDSVFHLHNHKLNTVDSSRQPIYMSHQKWYVQSPLITCSDITSFIKSIS